MGGGALEGVRVLDFGQYIAGPVAAMLLADQGADVIRVEHPDGPRYGTDANATWNRGKRSIVLDLKRPSDLDVALRLVEKADVLIENFRPGVMDRLGLGFAACEKVQPKLIYCSLPGFAADDPRAGMRAWEGLLGAAVGTYRCSKATGRPVYTVLPYASMIGAFTAATSIAAALIAREETTRGQRIEIPLFDSMFPAMGNHLLRVHGSATGRPGFEWSRELPTGDGRWVRHYAINKRCEVFLQAIGMAAIRDAGADDAELARRFEAIFRTRTAMEWEAYAAEIGAEVGTCNMPVEWLRHPQALASGIVADAMDPVLGQFRGVGICVRLSKTPGRVSRPRPMPDEHRSEILDLARQARSPEDQGRPPGNPLRKTLRAALEGVKVVDLCVVIAGPVCGRTLAEFGADVVKIDSPFENPIQLHNDVNRGKRSMLLDLKREEGKEVFWQLVAGADVVLQNFRPGVAEELGVDYESVRARRPDIVYCSVSTFGRAGPYAGRPGHESIAQAVTGMMMRYGGTWPALAPFSANDYGTGLLAAYAVALALLHRRRTGQGQHVDAALAYTATLLQSNVLNCYRGKEWNEPAGQAALGEGPFYRMYEAGNGWLFLATRKEELSACPGFRDLAERVECEGVLEKRFRERTVEEWVSLLRRHGIGVHRVVERFDELLEDPWLHRRGLVLSREHDGLGLVSTSGTPPRLPAMPCVPGRPASKPGADARSILGDIGMEHELDRLVRERVVVMEGVSAG